MAEPKQIPNALRVVMIVIAVAVIATMVYATFVTPPKTMRPTVSPAQGLARLALPPGFHIELYASVPSARQMASGPNGTLFVGTRIANGSVYAVPDRDHDGKADGVIELVTGLNTPNGVAVRDGALYVAEIPRILRIDNVETKLAPHAKFKVVYDKLPTDPHHGWKYIKFGPDGWLYVPIGAPCNVCVSPDARFASLMRIKPDGTGLESYAKGIRNTVGFDWDPRTHELYFTDNGRDWLGDDIPCDELDYAPHPGMNFGFPYRWGDNQIDKDFGDKAPAGMEFTPPALCLGPHVAALGMKFYTGEMFPKQYKNDVFVCEHGSWNRSKKIGYRVMHIGFKNGKPATYEPFITGFLAGDQPSTNKSFNFGSLNSSGEPWGRPVDVLQMPDGALMISDDHSGSIYRVTYKAP
ncbi:MAG: PQQ-dependent sugar dehydrogenase [Terriglobales bacterium]